MTYIAHRTHTGEIITGEKLNNALIEVFQDYVELAFAIRKEDAYASHITENFKDEILLKDLKFAEEIKQGKHSGFTIWQRVNIKLTGECIAFLP